MPEESLPAKLPAKYRKPAVFVAGGTRQTLKGHHGVGQESQGYAPKT
jgi:hypothetical protein